MKFSFLVYTSKGLGAGLCLRVGRQYTFICKLQVVKVVVYLRRSMRSWPEYE